MTAATKAAANGEVTAPEVAFPLDSFREAARHLRRPFTSQAVRFKVQATWPKDKPTAALVVAYIDARLAAERLNLIVPHLWFDEYDPPTDGRIVCRLTVDGITRQDVGEGVGKGLYSDAFKRAGVKFGIGVSAYAVPKLILNVGDRTVKPKNAGGKKTLVLTDSGEKTVRALYAKWLEESGAAAFGEPLSHGDVEGSVGDPDEANHVLPVPDEPEATPAKEPSKGITKKLAGELVDRATDVGVDPTRLYQAATHYHGDDIGGWDTKAGAVEALRKLTADQAQQLDDWISRKADQQEASDGS